MKKHLLLGFLVLFLLSSTAFAGLNDPKKDSEKPAGTTPTENKLSNEEMSRLSRRAEIDNMDRTDLFNNEKYASKKDLKAKKQTVYVEDTRHHGGYVWYGGGALLLVIILIILLV